METNRELTAASSAPIVLETLAEGDSYGFAILQRVRELSGGRREWKDGMLYPVLHRVERLGQVEARWVVAESGRRRKYYRITPRGRRTNRRVRTHPRTGPAAPALALAAIALSTVAAQSSRTLGQKFDSIASANLAQDRAVGAVVAVVRGDDTLFFRGYGKMDVERDVPMRTDAVFGIGSITKQFTAAAILRLRDQGKLSLDDDVTKWLPDFDTRGNRVPLRRLLDHTSGIRDVTTMEEFRILTRNAVFPRDSMYALVERHPFQFPTGTAQVYNNAAYWLLHLVVEKASGTTYPRYVESELFEPLGMTGSGLCLDAEEAPRRATGHHVRNGRVRRAPLNVSTWYLGSGVLCSTAGDLVTWMQALHGGGVLSPASYAEMTTPATLGDGTRTRYAMGLEARTDVHGLEYFGHSGELPGYAARANWYPAARMAVVVVMNNSGDASPSAMAQDLAAAVLPMTNPAPRPFTGDAAPLAGTYGGPARGGDMVVTVTRTPRGIAASVQGAPARLLPWVEGLTFQYGSALLTFRRANDGSGPATELRYDAGNGYYVLERLTTPAAMLARTRLLAERSWPLALLGLAAALASLAVLRRSRSRRSPSPTQPRSTRMFRPGSIVATALLLGTPTYAQDRTAEVDRIFSFATPETPGCAVGVSQHGQPVLNRAYGLAEVERRVPLSQRSAFDIGSTQKQFVAAAVLLLAEDGRLSLSDDVRRHLPELPDYGHEVTVDHLLTHTSGIRDWTGLLPMAEEGTDVLKLILRQRGLNFTPGEEWAYSNSGYVLLKEIVARASGMSFAEFARRRLFEPLGMTSSAYVADILQGTGERALGYQKEGAGWKQYMRLGNERGGGAVISTAGDLLLWNDALTNGRLGKVVTGKLQEPAALNNGRKLTYARGLMVNSIPGGPMVSHSGGAAGYSTWLGRFTDHGLSIAVLCNFDPVSATALAGRVAEVFLPPVDPQAQPPGPVDAPGVDVADRAGLFFHERTGQPLRLVVDDGRLRIANGPPLVAVAQDRFRNARGDMFFRSRDEFELHFASQGQLELKSMEGEVTRYRRAQPWSPTAADLQAFDGRYRSEELGSVFEIVPGASGLVMRFERSPDKALELTPVDRDTYMLRMMVVRFRRDESGRVVGFDYGNPLVRSLRFTRLGDRSAAPVAKNPAAASAAPTSPAPRLEGLTGEYELAPGRTVIVTLEDGRLHGQPPGGEKRPLVHLSDATFAVGQADGRTTVAFTVGADGRATAMVMRQNGNERTLPRVR
ncbi:MAG TPA: serine hydrolase [Longimicrobiaceae bacterium]|nr:serine hydrolase [Longimicrobiaceae bacterium]